MSEGHETSCLSLQLSDPSLTPGAWSGNIVENDGKNVWVTCSQEKWDKAKAIICLWLSQFDSKTLLFNHKSMERGRGFLVHLSTTFEWMKPLLKGIHLTLEMWRGNRDSKGWKITDKEWQKLVNIAIHGRREKESDLDFEFFFLSERETDKSVGVKLAPRLKSDLESLLLLMNSDTPSKTLLRGSKICSVSYGFGDAAKNGFGSSWLSKSGGIKYRVGVWNESSNADKSSNYRELGNLTETLEADTKMEGTEFFLFTDNTVAEGAFYKGSSSNKLLFF